MSRRTVSRTLSRVVDAWASGFMGSVVVVTMVGARCSTRGNGRATAESATALLPVMDECSLGGKGWPLKTFETA